MPQPGLKVEVTEDKINQFIRTGHPRTVGIVLGLKPNPNKLFADVFVTKVTVEGSPVEEAR